VSVAPAFTWTGEVRPVALLAGVQIVTEGLVVLKVHEACALARGTMANRAATIATILSVFTAE
jgi:hypothetical protein